MTELLDVSTEPVMPAQTDAPGTEPTGWMPLSDEARNTIPENIKGLFEAKKWSSVEDVAKSYSELEKILGKGEHIFKPESPDDKDAWEKYWQQIGVPQTVDEYEFEPDEEVPFDENILTEFKKFARDELHLSKEQASGIVKFQRDIIKAAIQADAQAAEEETARAEAEKETIRKALVTKAGGEVAYQNMMVEARQIADELGIYPALEKLGLASNPEAINMLVTIKERVTEGVINPSPPTPPAKDPVTELEEIKKSDAFKQRFHPKHKEIMDRFMQLNHIIANSGLAPKRPQGG